MIKNLIFDFGDIFINLDKPATAKELSKYGFNGLTPALESFLQKYEKGLINTDEFLKKGTEFFPKASLKDFKDAWNSVLLDFPEYRLNFIQNLAQENKYDLFLLSNTNALHIEHIVETMGQEKFDGFRSCFKKFYLSHEINLRKPDAEIYQFVIDENILEPTECLFIDDTKENTESAVKLGIQTWHLQVGKEDIIHLKQKL